MIASGLLICAEDFNIPPLCAGYADYNLLQIEYAVHAYT